jgi:hypothetical protein
MSTVQDVRSALQALRQSGLLEVVYEGTGPAPACGPRGHLTRIPVTVLLRTSEPEGLRQEIEDLLTAGGVKKVDLTLRPV